MIDPVWRDPGCLYQPVDTPGNQLELWLNPFLEVLPRHPLADDERIAAELEDRFGLGRQLKLRPADRLVKPIAELPLDEMDKCLQTLWDQRRPLHALEHLQVFGGVEKRQVVPPFEMFVRPAR